MKRILYLDLETFSTTPIKAGTYRYAADADILLFAYAWNDEPAQVIDFTDIDTWPAAKVKDLLSQADEIVAHNSMFDRNVLKFNGFETPLNKWRDTMVKAFTHSLVGSLGVLCDLVGVDADHAKDKDGKRLIRLFCQPQPKNRLIERADAHTHPADWIKFVEYARLDVEAMREVDRLIPNWNDKAELKNWRLDQKINDRGFAVDADLVEAALKAIDTERERLADETAELTGGAVASATQRDALLKYILNEYAITLPDLQKATLERRIEDPNTPPAVKELLHNRLQASTTSTSKYLALSNSVSDDGRLRGTLQFAGASRTGRWAGRTFQPQNLPRPTLKDDEIEAGIAALKVGAAEFVTDNLMELTASALRGCIIAPAGKKLIVSDLSNIEGRVQAWLSYEEWKLKAFRDFDAGVGHDLYKMAYAASFGVSPESVTSDQRQVGKVQELALGYGGGVGAFVTFATAYGINLDDLANDAWDALDEAEKNNAANYLERRKAEGEAPEMSDRAFIACDVIKRLWRNAHANTSALWYEIEDAVKSAIRAPGTTYRAGILAARVDGIWLRIRLPSGRYLCYPSVRLNDDRIEYKGMNQYTRKWQYLETYGGKLFENICQAVARDILADNMHRVEAAGYNIVLTVHDEIIAEAPDTDEYNAEELSKLLATNPAWAPGIPLAADGFESYRYKKD